MVEAAALQVEEVVVQPGRRHSEGTDAGFDESEQPQSAPGSQARRENATQVAPRPQARHERGNDDGHGVDANARVERQNALPHHLVDEGRDSAQQEGDTGEDDLSSQSPLKLRCPGPAVKRRDSAAAKSQGAFGRGRVPVAFSFVRTGRLDGPARDGEELSRSTREQDWSEGRTKLPLDGILTAGEQKGLRFVTVGELLAARQSTGGSPFPAGPTHAILAAGQAPVAQLDRAAAF